MAVVYRCDRCKLIGEQPTFLSAVIVPAVPAMVGQESKIVPAVDQMDTAICPDCLDKLRAFLSAAV